MPVESMDRDAKDRIVEVLGDVADLVDAGETPDEAIAKAASAGGLPRGHIPLAVYSYNIGRTNRQRADAASPQEKAASFPLASVEGVINALFPDAPVTKAASERKGGVDPVYLSAPARRKPEKPTVKAASAPAPVSTPIDIRIATIRREKRARVVAEARRIASAAKDDFTGALAKLASAFEAPGAPAIADVRRNVELIHGADGLIPLDYIAESNRALARKEASARFETHAISQLPAIYNGIARVIDQATKTAEVRAWSEAMAKEAAILDDDELAPFRPIKRPSDIFEEIEMERPKQAGIYDAVTNAAMDVQAKGNDDVVASALSRISSPEHEQALRAIQARSMIHEMLHDDEVLKGHDPYEVAHHYNRLSQFAPHLSEKPLAAIPAVRKSVQQGQLDTFDAKELADTETKLRPQHKQEGNRG